MEAHDDRPGEAVPDPDRLHLPPAVRQDELIATVDARPVPDPAAGRNVDHQRALSDD